jgi:hypothetical protein
MYPTGRVDDFGMATAELIVGVTISRSSGSARVAVTDSRDGVGACRPYQITTLQHYPPRPGVNQAMDCHGMWSSRGAAFGESSPDSGIKGLFSPLWLACEAYSAAQSRRSTSVKETP